MTLTIQFSPREEAWINAQAEQQGVAPAEVVARLVEDRLPEEAQSTVEPIIDAKNAAAIAMLQSWLEEDATDDPEQIRQAEIDLEELKRNLNANRAATGERLVFP